MNTMRRRRWLALTAGFFAATTLSLGIMVLTHGRGAIAAPPAHEYTPAQQQAVDQLKGISTGFEAVAQAVVPSVVTITSERVIQPTEAPNNPFNDPFFRRFFDVPQQGPMRERGLGSGVIVGSDGIILTNNHVVNGADELTVVLQDGRRLKAKVMGADPRSDLAVLKIDAGHLQAMPFGNSDEVKIGEWVLAVGSPFSENLKTTITAGIVSGTGRTGMHLSEYEDFIQTDAAINPGNSGGPLVNLDGELVGINSAIASRAGGYDGIGFAIPANMAMDVMNDLVKHGKVSRGYLGVGIQSLTQDLADAMNLDVREGAVITSVQNDGPAAKAGAKAQDVIVEFNGQPVKDSDQLRLVVARVNPGTTADMVVLRDGHRQTLHVKLGEIPDEKETASDSEPTQNKDLGLEVGPVTSDIARQLNLDTASGLVVMQVEQGSAAEEAGVQQGDLVRRVNQEKVTTTNEFRSAVKRTANGKPVLLQLQRGDSTFFVALRPEK
jgi:serine protease Do